MKMSNIIELINEISKIPDGNIMEKIIEYCRRNDMDVQEIGDKLTESEDFKSLLYKDCVIHHTIRDEEYKTKLDKVPEIIKW